MNLDANSNGFQVQKYHRLLARGFSQNGASVEVLSHPKNIEALKPEDRTNEKEDGIHYSYAVRGKQGYLGLLWKAFFATHQYLKQHHSSFVICDVLNLTVSLGGVLAGRLLNRKVIGIITDFPEQLSGRRNINSRLIWFLVSLCTGYVVLTEQMKEYLDSKKPVIVLEGHVNSDMFWSENTLNGKYTKKVCLYAGALHIRSLFPPFKSGKRWTRIFMGYIPD